MIKKNYMLIAGAVLLVVLFALPLELPYSIKAPCKILPRQEWLLVRNPDGSLVATHYDNLLGVPKTYSLFQAERGDDMQFVMHENIAPGDTVCAQDTLGFIRSNETERQLKKLTGELQLAVAEQKIYETGAKSAVIREAENKLERARLRAEAERRILARKKELYERNLISRQEFEDAEIVTGLAEKEIEIASDQLMAAKSGSKEELIALARSRIAVLQEEIATLRKRLASFIITAPMRGVLFRTFSRDTLLSLGQMQPCVAVLPVRVEQQHLVARDQQVEVRVPGSRDAVPGRIWHIGNAVEVVQGGQVIYLIAELNQPAIDVLPGMMAEAKIFCQAVRPVTFLARFLASVFH